MSTASIAGSKHVSKKPTVLHFNQMAAPAFGRPDKGFVLMRDPDRVDSEVFDALQPSTDFQVSREMFKKHHAGE